MDFYTENPICKICRIDWHPQCPEFLNVAINFGDASQTHFLHSQRAAQPLLLRVPLNVDVLWIACRQARILASNAEQCRTCVAGLFLFVIQFDSPFSVLIEIETCISGARYCAISELLVYLIYCTHLQMNCFVQWFSFVI